MSVYVVDSNFFIQAHRASYPLDVASGFWNKVKQLAEEKKIISIDKVKQEIYQNEDALKKWCEANLPKDFFKDTSTIMTSYGIVAGWATSRNPNYLPNALAEFLHADEADAYIVAYTHSEISDKIVVTQEIIEPLRRNKVKIPDVCLGLGVKFVNIIDMFRGLGETF